MTLLDSKPARLSALAVATAGAIYGLAANSAPVRIWERPAAPAERAEPPGPVTILPICASGWRCVADSADLLWCSCAMTRGAPEVPGPKPQDQMHIKSYEGTKCYPAGDGCNTTCCDERGLCSITTMYCLPKGTEVVP